MSKIIIYAYWPMDAISAFMEANGIADSRSNQRLVQFLMDIPNMTEDEADEYGLYTDEGWDAMYHDGKLFRVGNTIYGYDSDMGSICTAELIDIDPAVKNYICEGEVWRGSSLYSEALFSEKSRIICNEKPQCDPRNKCTLINADLNLYLITRKRDALGNPIKAVDAVDTHRMPAGAVGTNAKPAYNDNRDTLMS